jgi:diguanylate cyclase (GGDEF)-like protein
MKKSSLLVVDDSAHLHRLVKAYLQGDAVEVLSAFSGKDALDAAAHLQPDLILLDVDLPEMNGFEVCAKLKADAKTKNLRVMFLTSYASVEEKARGLDLGADDYIAKPFKPEEFCARIRAALKSSAHADDLTMVDELTRLWNATYLDRHVKGKLSLARRTNQPLTCVVGDIDGLGPINQTHGQKIGDEVVRSVARILMEHRREQDTICYLGSGKFVALLPGTSKQGAVQFADRARGAVEKELKECQGAKLAVTISFGISDNQSEEDAALVDRADAALFCAKQSGRNQVSVSRPTVEQVCAGSN